MSGALLLPTWSSVLAAGVDWGMLVVMLGVALMTAAGEGWSRQR